MEMKAIVEGRLAELKKAKDECQARHSAILGAESEAQFMLTKIFEEEAKAEVAAQPTEGESNATT